MHKGTREQFTIDAAGKSLGRVATEAARYLQGKHKPTWLPNIDGGAAVTITNLLSAKFTGSKMRTKIYYRHTNYPGNMKIASLQEMWRKDPRKLFTMVAAKMLPKNTLRKKMLQRLTIE